MALKWLLDIQHTRNQLSLWLLELQEFDFPVNYDPGDFTLLTAPDVLTRYIFDPNKFICTRYLWVVGAIEEGKW